MGRHKYEYQKWFRKDCNTGNIIDDYNRGLNQKEIAIKYNCSKQNVSSILRRHSEWVAK